jgi:hypothetical protein
MILSENILLGHNCFHYPGGHYFYFNAASPFIIHPLPTIDAILCWMGCDFDVVNLSCKQAHHTTIKANICTVYENKIGGF